MKKKVALILVFVLVLSVASLAFAAEGDVNISDTMKSSFQVVANDTIQMMSGVAPIALTIFGCMLCWKFGKNFFKNMTK